MKTIYALILDENTVDSGEEYYVKANLTELTPSQKFRLEQAEEWEQIRRMMERANMAEYLYSARPQT
jgi:hypothetical protein